MWNISASIFPRKSLLGKNWIFFLKFKKQNEYLTIGFKEIYPSLVELF